MESKVEIHSLSEKIIDLENKLTKKNLIIKGLKVIHSNNEVLDENGSGFRLVKFIFNHNQYGMYHFNLFLRFYFVCTLSIILRGKFFPLRMAPYLHVITSIAGFIAASKDLIWDIDNKIDGGSSSHYSPYMMQSLWFFVDILIHIYL